MKPSSNGCGEGRERGEILEYPSLNPYFDSGLQVANHINETEFLPSSNNIFQVIPYLYKNFQE